MTRFVPIHSSFTNCKRTKLIRNYRRTRTKYQQTKTHRVRSALYPRTLFVWFIADKVFVFNFISKPTRNNEIGIVQSIGSYKIVRSDFWFAIAYFWQITLTSTKTKEKNEKGFVKCSRQNTNKRTPNVSIQRANHASNKQGKHFVGQYNSGEGRRI